MAAAMVSWLPLDAGLGCFAPCRPCRKQPAAASDSHEEHRLAEYAAPGFSSSPVAVGMTARSCGGVDRADWTPRAARAPPEARSPSSVSSTHEFLAGTPVSARPPREPPSAHQDPASKARERSRLRALVAEFVQEAACGRRCSVVVLGDGGAGCGPKLDAWYELRDKAERFVLRGRRKEKQPQQAPELIGSWVLDAVLGAYKAEESALVHGARQELTGLLSDCELQRSAVLELGRGPCAACAPLLLVEDSVEHRDRFVLGMQIILRLFRGAREQAAAEAG